MLHHRIMKINNYLSFICLILFSCASNEDQDFSKKMKRECLVEKNHEACEARLYEIDPQLDDFTEAEIAEAKKIIRAVNPDALFNNEVNEEEDLKSNNQLDE